MPGSARVLWTAAAVLCLAAGAAGCASQTSGSQPPARTDPAPSAPSSPAPAGDPRALAKAAYLGMWQAYVAAARTADYQAPSLDHYAAGGALSVLTHGLYQEHQDGDVTLGQPVARPGRPAEEIAEETFAIFNDHPRDAAGAELACAYYGRRLRSLSFPGNRRC